MGRQWHKRLILDVDDGPQEKPSEQPSDPPQEPVTIDMPSVAIQDPAELDLRDATFTVSAEVVTTNETLFDMLFLAESYCLSLDDGPAYCWPLSQRNTSALFYRVSDGMHTVVGSITHPYTGEIIEVRHSVGH